MKNMKIILTIVSAMFLTTMLAENVSAAALTNVVYDSSAKTVKVCAKTTTTTPLGAAAGSADHLDSSSCGTAVVQCTAFPVTIYCPAPNSTLVQKTKTWNCTNNKFDLAKPNPALPNGCPTSSCSTTPDGGDFDAYGVTGHSSLPGTPGIGAGLNDVKYQLRAQIGSATANSPTFTVNLLNTFWQNTKWQVKQCTGNCKNFDYDTESSYYIDPNTQVSIVTTENHEPGQLEDEYWDNMGVSSSNSKSCNCIKTATGTSGSDIYEAKSIAENSMNSWNNPAAATDAKAALDYAIGGVGPMPTNAGGVGNDIPITSPTVSDYYYRLGMYRVNGNQDNSSTVVRTNNDWLIVVKTANYQPTKGGWIFTAQYPVAYSVTITKNVCP